MLALPLTVERNMLDMGSLLVLSTAMILKGQCPSWARALYKQSTPNPSASSLQGRHHRASSCA